MLQIIPKSKIWFTISGSLALISILLFIIFRLNLGIDFAGGTLIEMQVGESVQNTELTKVVENSGLELKSIQTQATGDKKFLIKTDSLTQEEHSKLKNHLKDQYKGFKENKFENVGPTVGKDLQAKAIWAVILASIAIILYIWYAFRRLPSDVSSFQFGLAAIVALLHDIIIVVGLFALLGHFYPSVQVDSYFIVALLTVMGFSVHDTIVVFDRLRENLLKEGSQNFEETANESVNQTIVRSINISLTLVIVLITLYLLGGTGIKNFVIALMAGTIIGTYSSIFVASPLVSWWHNQ